MAKMEEAVEGSFVPFNVYRAAVDRANVLVRELARYKNMRALEDASCSVAFNKEDILEARLNAAFRPVFAAIIREILEEQQRCFGTESENLRKENEKLHEQLRKETERLCKERERRVCYENIVYTVCERLKTIFEDDVVLGRIADDPATETRKRLDVVLARFAALEHEIMELRQNKYRCGEGD